MNKFNSSFPQIEEEYYKSISKKKRNYSKKIKNDIFVKSIYHKINAMKDKKLKYSYRLALISGLRVFEISNLQKQDIQFKDNKIFITVTNGKGGKRGYVECLEDCYLYKKLNIYLNQYKDNDFIFYKKYTLMNKAVRLGFETHDLRRIFANSKKNHELKNGKSIYIANSEVQKSLRHKRYSSTKRYLHNKKFVIKKVRK